MGVLVNWLEDIEPGTAGVGGKGAGLAAMTRARFRVPDGFVVRADIAMELGDRAWTGDEREQLVTALRRLLVNDGAVAVRSSATDEDSETASFAGQHLTVLDVRDEAALEDALRRVVASLRSEGAEAYRSRGDNAEAAMAVVVQRMVDPDCAGVAFSVDPVTGDASRVIVEVVRGSGEALVSGMVEADRFVFAREGLALLESRHVGDAVCAPETARGAAEAALRCETLFRRPQDIEFAFQGDAIWLLQSRAITATPSADDGWQSEFDTPTSDDDLWTSANVQEILPGLLTPLTMSVFEETVPRAYTMDYQRLKLLAKDENPVFMGLFYNRAFLNVTATRLIADRAIGGNADSLEHRYLGGEYQVKSQTKHSRTIWKRRALSAVPLVKTMLTLAKAADRIDRATSALEARTFAADPALMSAPELAARRREITEFGASTAPVHLQVTGIAGAGFEAVSRMLQPLLGDETEGLVPTLFTGMRGVESAQIGLDLWNLARIATRDGLAARLDDSAFDPQAADLPPAWRDAYAAFVARHGHRGLAEMEASTLTWRRNPAPVLAMVRSYLEIPAEQAPPATLARQERERLQLTDDFAKRMNPLKRRGFRYILGHAQDWVALRERTKSIIVRAARIPDHFVPDLQRRLIAADVIAAPDDMFFLSNDEISHFLEGDTRDLRADVTRRRREYERNRHVILPERFRGRPSPEPPTPPASAGDVLTGTPVSPGVVTGRARVIIDPTTDGPLQPGEVLVAPVTDAGWTPLFALASALVVDMGSALSHGSTVAREYGLPAVVNVRTGTRSIRTGDLVTVNGSKGTVTILGENPEP
jgi:pyruvate,water dikinase